MRRFGERMHARLKPDAGPSDGAERDAVARGRRPRHVTASRHGAGLARGRLHRAARGSRCPRHAVITRLAVRSSPSLSWLVWRPSAAGAGAAPTPPPSPRARCDARRTRSHARWRPAIGSPSCARARRRRRRGRSARGRGHAARSALQAGYSAPITWTSSDSCSPTESLSILYPDVPDNWRARLDMQWPDLHRRAGRSARACCGRRASGAPGRTSTARAADLRLETTRAFWALVTATDAVRVVSESVTRIDAQLRDVRARFDAGFLPPNDVLTVEARASRGERILLIDAESRRDAPAPTARLIGHPCGRHVRG